METRTSRSNREARNIIISVDSNKESKVIDADNFENSKVALVYGQMVR